VVAAPAAEPALFGAAALFTLLAWAAMLGLQHGWGATFGPALQWIADKFDAVAIRIPHLGHIRPFGTVAAAIRALDHNVKHALGAAALNCEHATTYLWSHAAAQVRNIARWIEDVGLDIGVLVHRIEHRVIPRAIRWAVHIATHTARVIAHDVERVAARWYRHALHDIQLVKAYALRAEHAAAHALGWSEVHVGRTAKQARAHARRISRLEGLLTGAAAVALVGTALGKLGLRWLRCSNVKRTGRALCRLNPEWITTLLSDAFEAMVVLDLCRYALAAQRLGRLVVPELGVVLLVQNAVCLGGGASLPSAHDSPKTSTSITLPSAHD